MLQFEKKMRSGDWQLLKQTVKRRDVNIVMQSKGCHKRAMWLEVSVL